MLDMSWLNNSIWSKEIIAVEPFQSTGRATGGQWFVKLHFDPTPFPVLVLGPIALDWAWVQLGHPVFLTEDGKHWRPRPERPPIIQSDWLLGHTVEFRFELKDFSTRWQGEKTYLAPRFLKLKDPSFA